MGSKYRNSFFDTKRPWSAYKDSILGYYLTPYLQKVKKLGKPITIVDMFAGRGEFKNNEPGSPLIIARKIKSLSEDGYDVHLRCYENHQPFYDHLQTVLKPFAFAKALPQDCFTDIDELVRLASAHTVLLYVDPCDVSQLRLSRLGLIYDRVNKNSSVEALVVFMARAFMRQAAVSQSLNMQLEKSGILDDPLIEEAEEDDKAMLIEAFFGDDDANRHAQLQRTQTLLTDIAGGDYWRSIVKDKTALWDEKCAKLVDEYLTKLRKWFKVAEAVAVHSDDSAIPKYWIAFVSRYEPAFDLFNRAACQMSRAQRQNFRQPGSLFQGTEVQPEKTPPSTVDRAVKRTAQKTTSVRWQELRWRTCGNRNVGRFTDSEIDQSIKRLLKEGWLSGASGDKVEEKVELVSTQQLKSWIDR